MPASSIITHVARCTACDGSVALELLSSGFRYRCDRCRRTTPTRTSIVAASDDVRWQPLGLGEPRSHTFQRSNLQPVEATA